MTIILEGKVDEPQPECPEGYYLHYVTNEGGTLKYHYEPTVTNKKDGQYHAQ